MSKNPREPVLLAVDFSPDSESAFLWASKAAKRFAAPLLVLHVIHDPESAPGYYSKTDAAGRLVSMEESAREMLDGFLTRMRAHPNVEKGVEIAQRLATGLPATRILEVAAEEGAQLIVMGSRGRTGLEHLLLGSKAERVAQLSPIPVTIVKRSEAGTSDEAAD